MGRFPGCFGRSEGLALDKTLTYPKASNPPGVFIARGTASGLKQRVSDVNQERSQSGKKPHLYGEAVGDGGIFSTLRLTLLLHLRGNYPLLAIPLTR